YRLWRLLLATSSLETLKNFRQLIPNAREGGPWPTEPMITAIATSTASNENLETDCSKLTNCASWNWTPSAGEDVSTYKSGKVLYVAGCIYYKGLDDRLWFTDYCVSWEGGQDFLNCPNRNHVH